MVDITVFGSADSHEHEGCGCGCGHAHSMRDAAEVLKKALIKKFGDHVRFSYVDVFSEEVMDFPDVMKVMNQYRLPLTVINGEPRFYGGLSLEKISAAVAELLGVV
ncbi:MAG: hypothetical protein ACN4A7_06175 [Thermacetogeniaceae bacterium]|nr:hypothetical protein [Thermoanaerobacterales bacterium]NLN22256.1 hypothetical protein [Syntrophomonadaceae bacterium]HAF16747.1 hypothetical protein [Peptococcaceae bacterium]